MRIYIVCEHYPSLFKPYFDTQFEQFVRDGHEVSVFAFARGERAPTTAGAELARVQEGTRYLPAGRGSLPRFAGRMLANALGAPWRRASAVRRARRATPPRIETIADVARLAVLPAEPPDLCLVHNLIAARWVRFLRDLYPGAPIAFYYHGGELPGVPEVPAGDAVAAFAAADVVFTNTERSKRHAMSRGCPGDKVVVSPVGFNFDEFPVRERREFRRGDRLNLVSAGRLSPEKGFSYAVEAARQLVDAGITNFHYDIIGGGPLATALRSQIATAGLERYVRLVGPVSRADVLRTIAEADVLILPSIVVGTWEENQACVVQEAMLAETVVVASSTGGVPESLAPELHRFLVPEGDATAIAEAVRQLAQLSGVELAELGAAGRRFALARYDIRRLNAQILEATLACRDRPAPAAV